MAVRTFLITDIEGSTRLVQLLGDSYAGLLRQHNDIMSRAIADAGGEVLHVHGDSFVAAFDQPAAGVRAALDAQRALTCHRFAEGVPVRVRMGLDSGDAVWTGDTFVGLPVHVAARVSAAAQGGRILMSAAVADQAGPALPEDAAVRDLGLHRLKDLDAPVRIFDLRHPELPSDHPPIRSLSAQPHNLPAALTRFIGRSVEQREIRKLLEEHRLVTLTGVGGAGKTRLALQVAGDLVDRFVDGVWLVGLTSITDGFAVPRAIARVFGVNDRPGQTILDSVCEHLSTRSCLIVLDNCEHLLGRAAEVADVLLARCPSVRILATSREPLQLSGEIRWAIPPLELPSEQESAEGMATSEAVALFCDRAATAQPGFALDGASASSVAEICRRLDGIPLAIELAADQVRMFHPVEIARLLNERFVLLGGRRGGTAHHRSLHASLEWSYELLADDLRATFRALGVFGGPFTVEAAEAVAGAGVTRRIAQLVDRSLLTFDGDRRYAMLESVRAFAAQLLEHEDEVTAMRAALVAWARTFAKDAARGLIGAEKAVWLDRVEADLPNLRVAMDHAAATEPEVARRLVADLFIFWDVRRYREEGLRRAEALLDGEPSDALAAVTRVAGGLSDRLSEHEAAERYHERALELSRMVGDRRGEADALRGLGSIAWARGEPKRTDDLFTEALEGYEEIDSGYGMAMTLHGLAILARQRGDLDLAVERYQRSLDLFEALGDEEGVATDLTGLAGVAWRRGQPDQARDYQMRAIEVHRRTGNLMHLSGGLANLGVLELETGRAEHAVELLRESVSLADEAGDIRLRSMGTANLGLAFWEMGDASAARAQWEEALETQRGIASSEVPVTLGLLAEVAIADHRLDEAEGLLTEGTALAERHDRADARTAIMQLRALLALERGELQDARTRAAEVLDVLTAEGNERGIVTTLVLIARLAAADGDAGRAMRLLGGADALAQRGAGSAARARREAEALRSELLAEDPGLHAAWDASATLDRDAVLALARAG